MMCIQTHASLLVSVRRRNVVRHLCWHVAEAAAADVVVVVVVVVVVDIVGFADSAAEQGTAVSRFAGADVVAPAVVSLDRVAPHLPRAVAMRSGCAVVRSSEAEPAGSVHTACIP